jgi:P-type Ca2+ transporter type 2C
LPSVIGGSLAAQCAAMLLPGLRNLLGVGTIDVLDAVVMIAGGALPFFVNAARKTEQVQKTTLHFRRVKSGSAPAPQVDEARMGVAGSTREQGGPRSRISPISLNRLAIR